MRVVGPPNSPAHPLRATLLLQPSTAAGIGAAVPCCSRPLPLPLLLMLPLLPCCFRCRAARRTGCRHLKSRRRVRAS